MSRSREIELKLEVPMRNLPRLAASPLLKGVTTLERKPADLVSTYFDTNKLKLRQHGLSLRVRRIGSRLVQTVKQEHNGNAALFTRGEGETRYPHEPTRSRRSAGYRASAFTEEKAASKPQARIRNSGPPKSFPDPKWQQRDRAQH